MTDKKPTDSSNVANKKPVPDDKYRGMSFDTVVFDELRTTSVPLYCGDCFPQDCEWPKCVTPKDKP